ncbi:hypothetical protein CDO52_23100 [Nocardiopsis gilva YIM 90087]|uniref:Uncharacterized protein n=1 Tax=Nocardiopsis gilva YIM 90087 TaxID=1235441 RepID=A0A223SB20_9ACTN|nr:hypothetical protein [Nocardiopsis gilva]ASU85292.1 hypothetical protein CDO52_23100 [Nocardiopsis gilva YIM 90087]
MYIPTVWPNVLLGAVLIVVGGAFVVRRGRWRSREATSRTNRTFLEWLPVAMGLMVVLAEAPRLLGAPTAAVTVTDTVAHACGLVGIVLLARGTALLIIRGVRAITRGTPSPRPH